MNFKKKLVLSRNIRFFWNYVKPFLYICIIFVCFLNFEKWDPFATNGNHLDYSTHIYYKSQQVLDFSNKTRLAKLTFFTCITAALIIIFRLFSDFIHLKRLEYKISRFRPEVQKLMDARTLPVNQVEENLPDHLKQRFHQEVKQHSVKNNFSEKLFVEECIKTIINERAEHFIKNSSNLLKVSPVRLNMRKEDEFTENQEVQLQKLLDERLDEAFRKYDNSNEINQLRTLINLNNAQRDERRLWTRIFSCGRRR